MQRDQYFLRFEFGVATKYYALARHFIELEGETSDADLHAATAVCQVSSLQSLCGYLLYV